MELAIMSSIIKKQAKYYAKHLSNFSNVCRDTNNKILECDDWDYNCMGYALGTYIWEKLEDFRILNHWWNDEEEIENLEEVLYDCVEEILERFSNLRKIQYISDAQPVERVIAMRIGLDDFHFARLGSDGIWTHKPGHSTIREMSEAELFSDAWSEKSRECPYISDVIFFAIKEND